MWLPDVHTLPLTTLPPLTSQGCDVGTAGKLPHQLGDSGGRKAPGGPEVWWGPPLLPGFSERGKQSSTSTFSAENFYKKIQRRSFLHARIWGSFQTGDPRLFLMGRQIVYKGFKKKTKQENLDSSFFSLLLLCQSHSGCLLTDRTEELERTVGRV